MKIVDAAARDRAVARCRELGVVIPTLSQQRDPSTVDSAVTDALIDLDMQAPDPLNLFRITWRNDPRVGWVRRGQRDRGPVRADRRPGPYRRPRR